MTVREKQAERGRQREADRQAVALKAGKAGSFSVETGGTLE